MDRKKFFLGVAIICCLLPVTWSAVKQLQINHDRQNRAEAHARVAEAATKTGRHKKAIVAYQRALDLSPELSGARRALVLLQCRVSAIEPATLNLAAARQLSIRIELAGLTKKDGPEVAVAIAQIDLIRGETAQAHAAFESIVKDYPKAAIAHFVLGKSRLLRGSVTQAIDALSKASKLAPESAVYHRVLGNALHGAQKWARAEEELLEAAERKDDGMTRLLLGEAQLRLKKAAAAVESLARAKGLLTKPTLRARSQAALGFALHRVGKNDQAVVELAGSYRVTQNDQTLLNMAVVYQAMKDHARAARLFKKALQKRPLDGPGHLQWLRSVMALGQKAQARKLVARLADLAKSHPQLGPIVQRARTLVGSQGALPKLPAPQ